jgi:hypothetical protein
MSSGNPAVDLLYERSINKLKAGSADGGIRDLEGARTLAEIEHVPLASIDDISSNLYQARLRRAYLRSRTAYRRDDWLDVSADAARAVQLNASDHTARRLLAISLIRSGDKKPGHAPASLRR